MRLKVEHLTQFEYDAAVYETATEVRLHPADHNISTQHLENFTLEVDPPTSIYSYTDYFGNQVHYFSLLQSHEKLSITTSSVVSTGAGSQPATDEELLKLFEFTAASPYVNFSPAVIAWAARFPVETASENPKAMAEQVCREINRDFQYEKGVTDVDTTVDKILELKSGVCQDFAHLMIALCRCLGLPSRYISGYLYTGADANDKRAGASHAWCEVYCGPEEGWVGFDPTHSTVWVNENYIKIGGGRDYSDVTPVRGTYKGKANENLKVEVRVSVVD